MQRHHLVLVSFAAFGWLMLGCGSAINNRCQNVVCDVPGTVCDPADGLCKASGGATDAGSGCNPACQAPTAVCVGNTCKTCSASAGCQSPTPICSTAANGGLGACVQCLANIHCSAPTPVCNLSTSTCESGGAVDGGADGGTDGGLVVIPDGGTAIVSDSCANVTDITSMVGQPFTVDTTLATNDFAGSCTSSDTHRDVVYKLTLTTPRDVTVTAAAAAGSTTVDPVIYLRRSPCGSTTAGDELACQDEGAGGDTETFRVLNLPAGDYFVYVEGFGSIGAGPTEVTVSLSGPTPPPANDTCASPQALAFTNNVATTSGDTTAALNDNTSTDASPSCSLDARSTGRDVVFTYELTQAQDVEITVTPTGASPTFKPVVYVRKPGMCTSSSLADQVTCVTTFNATAQVVSLTNQLPGIYSVWVDGYDDTSGPFSIQVRLSPPTPAPTNDTCATVANAIVDGGTSATFTVNPGAAGDHYAGSCAGRGAPEVVYRVDVAQSSDLLFTSTGAAGVDPVLYVGAAPCEGADAGVGRELACRDSTFTGGTESILLGGLDAGTYYLFVDAFGVTTSGLQTVTVKTLPAPTPGTNDTCASAAALSFPGGGGSTTFQVDTSASADDYKLSCSAAGVGGKDVVYQVTLSAPSSLVFRAVGAAGVDPVIAVGDTPCQGADAGVGNSLECKDLTGMGGLESITLNRLDAGTYYLFVDGYSTVTSGVQAVTVTVGAPIP
ncbi:MAG: hypothetical protein ACOZIN_01930 [Myxococcota bacterium]